MFRTSSSSWTTCPMMRPATCSYAWTTRRFSGMRRTSGLGEGCNQGAAAARGRYFLFLNNDAQLTQGCLRTLLDTAARVPDCGAVGSKIVTPDGRLQEA